MSSTAHQPPPWLAEGLAHLWLPYAQMKTEAPPLAVARTEGCRIVLADGRVLIDGVASWWTSCHGYNHPHIRNAVARQLFHLTGIDIVTADRKPSGGEIARDRPAHEAEPDHRDIAGTCHLPA